MKMKAKGLDIALIRLLIVCYLTCNFFKFFYKFSRKKFGKMAIFSELCDVKRKGYHIVITQDIRLLFTRINVKRSVYVISKSVLLIVGIKKRALHDNVKALKWSKYSSISFLSPGAKVLLCFDSCKYSSINSAVSLNY